MGTILPGNCPLHRQPDREKHGQRSRTAANGQSDSHKKGQHIHYAQAAMGGISAIALGARTSGPARTNLRRSLGKVWRFALELQKGFPMFETA